MKTLHHSVLRSGIKTSHHSVLLSGIKTSHHRVLLGEEHEVVMWRQVVVVSSDVLLQLRQHYVGLDLCDATSCRLY